MMRGPKIDAENGDGKLVPIYDVCRAYVTIFLVAVSCSE